MDKVKNIVIIGEEEIGKTTLANALLGWDIFPQTNDGWYAPTKENASQMLTGSIRLTDTPGYDLLWYRVPEAVNEAVSGADTIIMMLKGFCDESNIDLADAEPKIAEEIHRWLAKLAKEEKLQKDLLAEAKTRDIYFVLPFYSEDGPLDQAELDQDLDYAQKHFASFSDHGEEGFFCIDPMMALMAAIEDDHAALERSGILSLKAALLGTEE